MDTSTTGATELLADRYAPGPDVVQTRHLVVAADREVTYSAARGIDFADVHGGLVDAAMWVRGLPQRWRDRRRGAATEPTQLKFDDLTAASGWVVLGERPGEEIAAGAVGRFWIPVIVWREVGVDRFAAFDEPGYGKIVLSLSVRPYGGSHTLLTYDVRVTLTDPGSRARFRLYWAVVAPFVRVIQDATLRTIARHAEEPAVAAV
jgi:hypothetical protein